MYHNPVLLNECIDGLNINPDGIYVDVTFGGGGHLHKTMNPYNAYKQGKLVDLPFLGSIYLETE